MIVKQMADSVELTHWKIFETDEGTTHLVGISDIGRGSVSTPLESFDSDSLVAQTVTGAEYRLVGAPATDSIVRGVWKYWCELNDVRQSGELSLYDLVLKFEDTRPAVRS